MSKELGLQFVSAVAENKLEGLKELFTDDIVFTAATPTKTWRAIGKAETEKTLREFFPAREKISNVERVNHYLLPGRSRISYVFRGHEKEFGAFQYEHQAYYQIVDNKISHLRILCSGLYKS